MELGTKTVAYFRLSPKRRGEAGRRAQWPAEMSRGRVGRLRGSIDWQRGDETGNIRTADLILAEQIAG
jgi:hypothetical protein